MTALYYVIGKVDEEPRMIVGGIKLIDAKRQLQTDEIVFTITDFPTGRVTISADGKSLSLLADTFAERQTQKLIDARNYRDTMRDGSTMTPAGVVQTDPTSRDLITGAALMATIAKAAGAAYSINWTMMDNSIVALDADGMITMGLAVGVHVSHCQDVGNTIRDEINGALDEDALDLIDITAGY